MRKITYQKLLISCFFTSLLSFTSRWAFLHYHNIDIFDVINNPSISFASIFTINGLRLTLNSFIEAWLVLKSNRFDYATRGLNIDELKTTKSKSSNVIACWENIKNRINKMDIRSILNPTDITPGQPGNNGNTSTTTNIQPSTSNNTNTIQPNANGNSNTSTNATNMQPDTRGNTNSNINTNTSGNTNTSSNANTTNTNNVTNQAPYNLVGGMYVISDPQNAVTRGFFNPATGQPYASYINYLNKRD